MPFLTNCNNFVIIPLLEMTFYSWILCLLDADFNLNCKSTSY